MTDLNNSKKPLLSICIPTFNRDQQLKRTLKNLTSQCEREDVEIIISDNASHDGTLDNCRGLVASNDRIGYQRHSENIGFSNNLISALNRANGEYVWMLGDDEILHPEAVRRILSTLERDIPAWLICDFVKLNSSDDSWPVEGEINVGSDLKRLTLEQLLSRVGIWASFMSLSIVKRSYYGEWVEKNKGRESDYIGFDIALFSGTKGHCSMIADPLLARVRQPLNKHRFDKLSVYMFDFFDPIDEMVKKGHLKSGTRKQLAYEMFNSMAGYLLLKAKIQGEVLPPIKEFLRYHSKLPLFWLAFAPIIVLPSFFVKGGIKFISLFVSKKSNSKLSKLICSLDL